MNDDFIRLRSRIWLFVLGGLVIFFLVVPVLIVIPMSFSSSSLLEFPPRSYSLRWYAAVFGAVEWRDAAWMSLQVAVLTTVLVTPLGTAASYGLHLGGFRATGLMRMLALAPLLVPVILVAVGIFYLYAVLGLNNTLFGLVLAHAMLALPFVVVSVSAGLRSYDMAQEQAARSLGAPWFRAFRSITLPQIRLSVLSGALLAFISSFDEVVVATFISGGEYSTLPRRMFSALRGQIEPTIAAISTVLIVLSITTAAALQFARRPDR